LFILPIDARNILWNTTFVERSSVEVSVSFKTTVLSVIGAMAHVTVVTAQTPQPAAATSRTVVAATKLPSVTDKALRFRAVGITVPPGKKQNISSVDGILYQLSGMTEVAIGGEIKVLSAGEGMFIAAGKSASLSANGGPSSSIHFILAPVGDSAEADGAMKELYRTPSPIPDLKPGPYDVNLTRVTFPAQMPSNAPHHRTGAALYYILSGSGANTVEGKTEMRAPGTYIYEPAGLVHQWGNPGDTPLTFLSFNLNQEGVPAVVADPPAKNQ
jgi:quercetin dioxygenase-like cupin family protein